VDIERLLGSVIEGALTGRRKRGAGTLRFLRGGSHAGSSFLNASTLLTLAGLAWGVFETVANQHQAGSGATGSAFPPGPQKSPAPSPVPRPTDASERDVVPPPLPAATASTMVSPAVPSGVARIIRVTVAAARADGTLTELERSSIVGHARQAGAESVVEEELAAPTPLRALVAGLQPGLPREDLYTLAFSIVRADESVSDAERAWLAELAEALELSSERVEALEGRAASRIAEAAPPKAG
jgi:uncharacterized membrane protein YebE (DUF533 family)